MGLPEKGVPSFREIQAAAAELGIEVGKLGPAVEQIKINEEAMRAAEAFDTLTRAGVNADEVLRGAAGKIDAMVDSALSLGLSLPAEMKPMVDRMRELGLFTGDTKDKLDNLVFKPTLEQSVQALIDKLGTLIDTLRGPQGLDAAIGTVANRRIDVGVNFVPENSPDDVYRGGGEYPAAHMGGFITPYGVQSFANGGEVLARLHAGEFVMRPEAVRQIGVGTLARMNRTGSAGAGEIHVHIHADEVFTDDYGSLTRYAEKIARALEYRFSSFGYSMPS
jgi:hypothetical protein